MTDTEKKELTLDDMETDISLYKEAYETNEDGSFEKIGEDAIKTIRNFVDGGLEVSPDNIAKLEEYINLFTTGTANEEIKNLGKDALAKLTAIKESSKQIPQPEKGEELEAKGDDIAVEVLDLQNC